MPPETLTTGCGLARPVGGEGWTTGGAPSARGETPHHLVSPPPRIMRGAFFLWKPSKGMLRCSCTFVLPPRLWRRQNSLRGGWTGGRDSRVAHRGKRCPIPPQLGHRSPSRPPAPADALAPSRARAFAAPRAARLFRRPRARGGPLTRRALRRDSSRRRLDDLDDTTSPGCRSSRRPAAARPGAAVRSASAVHGMARAGKNHGPEHHGAGGDARKSPSTGSALTLRNPQVQQPPSNPR